MSDLYDKSLRTLELDRVLELLAGCAASEAAKQGCLNIRPSADPEHVVRLQAETSAASRLITIKGSPGFQGIKDIGAALERADLGGVLNTRELLDIAGVLRAARGLKDYASGSLEKTCIDHLFSMLKSNKFLEEKIGRAIVAEDEIADAASPTLADIRRHMRIAGERARESVQRVISSPTLAKYLREPIVTLRSDRYVVPVKSEHKNDIPGLVHDVSSSGGTFFIEPMQSVQANNELRELIAQEKKEIERILAELSADAAAHRDDISEDYKVLVWLDMIFARAKLSFQMSAAPPEVKNTGALELKRARHPLINPKTVVPVNVRLGADFDTLVITGPNTGGKTVTLKTIGLLTLMAECGLHIPADDGSSISVFEHVLADIGDEQSIEQSLSTFSSHMRNIVSILQEADKSSLILFDELGAGTDPVEGAALAIAIIEYVRKLGAKVAATTHYAEMKVYAMRTGGVENASCEFDVETLKPTYKLLIGIPGKSNAFAISRRLGLDESVIEQAKQQIDENSASFEDVILQLEQQRQAMESARQEAEQLKAETEKNNRESEEYRRTLTREKQKAVDMARKEAQGIIDNARATADNAFAELSRMRRQLKESADWQKLNDEKAQLRQSLNAAEDALGAKPEKPVYRPPSRPIVAGDTVELISIGTRASVISVEKDGSLQLQAGIMKVKAKPNEVLLVEQEEQREVRKYIEKTSKQLNAEAVAPEVDLRGMMADEAIGVLDLFLDNAIMANLPSVRVIHGKGTGILRNAVSQHLKNNKDIKSFRLGRYGEGEDGVTVVEIS